jgi:Spx/MgsR family transcriptional regulator
MDRIELPTLYYKRGCSGCERARAWLAQYGLGYQAREIFREPLEATEIEDLLGDREVKDVLSTRTTEYKARGLDRGTHSDAELLRQMEAEPRLLRRPLLAFGDQLLIGFDAARWAQALGVAEVSPGTRPK